MQKKLTLRMESALSEQAKLYAQVREVSLSQFVAEYVALLVTAGEDKGSFKDSLPPITRSL